MNYLQYYPTDVVNGEGTRCTLFVSGCTHGCRGCYNQKSWSFDNGVLFDEAMEQQIINDLKDTRIKRQGLTLSGGDPMHPRNVEALLPFVQRVKKECPDKDIWVWTGYTMEDLMNRHSDPLTEKNFYDIINTVNVIVDGPFVEAQKPGEHLWRGSGNQRLLKMENGHYTKL